MLPWLWEVVAHGDDVILVPQPIDLLTGSEGELSSPLSEKLGASSSTQTCRPQLQLMLNNPHFAISAAAFSGQHALPGAVNADRFHADAKPVARHIFIKALCPASCNPCPTIPVLLIGGIWQPNAGCTLVTAGQRDLAPTCILCFGHPSSPSVTLAMIQHM